MARWITIYHPDLDATAVVAEDGYYAKGGLRDKGWVIPKPKRKRTAKPKPSTEEDDE